MRRSCLPHRHGHWPWLTYNPPSPSPLPVESRKSGIGGLSPQRERQVKQLILERLGESLEVTELARACSLSRSHFSRAFKCSTGLSPQDWIRTQRLARAKLLIQHTDLSLTQISLECGFCDQAHFCHMFTRSEGINPFAWRCQVMREPKASRSQPAVDFELATPPLH